MAEKIIPKKTVLQIKITLRHSKPPIWRRFQVESNVTLGQLHRILQILMGWWDGHLHQFRAGDVYYADLHPEEDLECFYDAIDENMVKVSAVLEKVKQKVVYEYDFGDGWEHELVLEKILEPDGGVQYPVCTGGKRRCPPEDCGGIGGYRHMLTVIKDPTHPEHLEMLEWAPEGFDAEEFEPDEVNAAFRAANL